MNEGKVGSYRTAKTQSATQGKEKGRERGEHTLFYGINT